MSDVWDDSYDTTDPQPQGNNTIKTLRDLHDADSKRIKALEEQLNGLQKEAAQSKVAEALASHGIPAKAAKLYSGDPDPAAVAAWAEENRDLFGSVGTNPTEHIDDGPSITPAPTMSQQEQADYQRVIDAGVDGVKPGHYNDAMAALLAAQTPDELREVYRRFG